MQYMPIPPLSYGPWPPTLAGLQCQTFLIIAMKSTFVTDMACRFVKLACYTTLAFAKATETTSTNSNDLASLTVFHHTTNIHLAHNPAVHQRPYTGL